MPSKKIYLAGKISKGDWRESLVDKIEWPEMEYSALAKMEFYGGEGVAIGAAPCCAGEIDYPQSWPILEKAVLGIFDYVGPYFISCDHGCFHGNNTHGSIEHGEPDEQGDTPENEVALGSVHGGDPKADSFISDYFFRQQAIKDLCLKAIQRCDIVFAWIDSLDAFGTFAEIGYAVALDKEVFLAGPQYFPDMWFMQSMCYDQFKIAKTPIDALRAYIADRQYIARPRFDSPIEEMFWDAWQDDGGAANSVKLEYQYVIPGTSYRVDFANLEEKVAIELDGYEYHNSKDQFTKDRQRQREIEKTGWRFVRFSGSEVYRNAVKCFDEAASFIVNLWYQRTQAATPVDSPEYSGE